MAQRVFDGPGEAGRSFVTDEEAARFLGVSDDTFLRMVGAKKGGAGLPGVAEWMRPHGHGHKRLWDVDDVIVLRHILVRRQTLPTPHEGDSEEKS